MEKACHKNWEFYQKYALINIMGKLRHKIGLQMTDVKASYSV
jgi:hypothetical protein